MSRSRSAATGRYIAKSKGSMRLSDKATKAWKNVVEKSKDQEDSGRKVKFR